jgi:hypothetical protein
VIDDLRQELLALAAEDQAVRAELAADGSLFEGYHPRTEGVHRRNAAALTNIIEQYGWPGHSLVGEDGAQAAWLILQHAIGNPSLQRRGLEWLRQAVAAGEVPAWQVALLEDRIRVFEGKPQRYGTQFDWDQHGQISPLPIEDEAQVEERRQAVGLPPLAEDIRRKREGMAEAKERPPADWKGRQRQMNDWARSVGWRD